MQSLGANDTAAWECAIDIQHVTKTFVQRQRPQHRNRLRPFQMEKKEVHALWDVSLQIHPGEFVAYAGPNGAGKSTTFKLLCGLLAPDEGEVRSLGLHPMQQRIPLMRRCGVFFGNRSELWWDHPVLTSFEWKQVVWDIPKNRYQRMLDVVTELLDLKPFLGTFVRELSLGQRMRADLGLLMLHEPELVLLDEPTLGLDVLAKRRMIDFLKHDNQERGSTILVTSHDMDDLTEMARRIILIHQGHIAFDGSRQRLREATGQQRTLMVTCPGDPPSLRELSHLSSDGDRHTYSFDADQVPMPRLMQKLAQMPGLLDVETGQMPMEAVIADLYRHWQSHS